MDASWRAIAGPGLPSFSSAGPQYFLLCLGFRLLHRVLGFLLRMLHKAFELVETLLAVVEGLPEIVGGHVREALRRRRASKRWKPIKAEKISATG